MNPGDPLAISARAFNEFVDAALYARGARRVGAGRPGEFPLVPACSVYVRNDTGGDLGAFAVVKLGDPLVSAVDAPFDAADGPCFEGLDPTGAGDDFAILSGPAPDGELARAVVLGVVPVDVDVSDGAHGYAAPASGVTATLASAADGPAKILWREAGSVGVKRALVLIDRSAEAAAPPAADVTAWKTVVRAATTANGTLATAFENGDAIDGVTLATGDRILVKDQSSATENGIYVVAASGAPTRATDADTGAELLGSVVFVSEGTTNKDTIWAMTANATITLGSTSLTWIRVFPNKYYGTGGFLTLTTSYQSSGTFDLPAGKWLVTTVVLVRVGTTAGSLGTATVELQLYDQTGAAVVGSHSPWIQQGTLVEWSSTFVSVVTLGVPSTIALEARKLSTETYSVAQLQNGFMTAERVV